MMEYSFLELSDFNAFINYKEYKQYRINLEEFNNIPNETK